MAWAFLVEAAVVRLAIYYRDHLLLLGSAFVDCTVMREMMMMLVVNRKCIQLILQPSILLLELLAFLIQVFLTIFENSASLLGFLFLAELVDQIHSFS